MQSRKKPRRDSSGRFMSESAWRSERLTQGSSLNLIALGCLITQVLDLFLAIAILLLLSRNYGAISASLEALNN